MITSAQKFRLGVFLFISFLTMMGLFLFFFSAKIFKDYDYYKIRFTNVSVSGLDVGSQVKYLGVRIGAITRMEIEKEDIRSIVVTFAVSQGDSLKNDVRAVITPMGITGLNMIELQGGTNEAPYMKPGSFLRTGSSFTASITGKAEVIGEKLELVLNNLIELTGPANLDKSKIILEKSANTLTTVDEYLSKNKSNFEEITSNLNETVYSTRMLVGELRTSVKRIEEVTTSKAFSETFSNMAEISRGLAQVKWDSTAIALNRSINTLDRLLQNVDRTVLDSRADLNLSLSRLRETSIELKEFSERINSNPGLLFSGANRNDAKSDLPELKP